MEQRAAVGARGGKWGAEKLAEQRFSQRFIRHREQIKGSWLRPRGFAVALSHPGPVV